MFVPGQIYRRRDLHGQFGGQQQGGISTPSQFPLVFLFTGKSGTQHGYRDGWQADDLFFYTGEGQRGDMRYVSGNRAIRDHLDDGKDLHLFEQAERAHVRYVGQFVSTGSHSQKAPGTDGVMRNAIVFELVPIADFTSSDFQRSINITESNHRDRLQRLRKLAIADSADMPSAVERRSAYRRRSEAIRIYIQERAEGSCEGCAQPAPFIRGDGTPYLEPHHIRRLSDGGPDHPRWVIGLCANCHRRAHYGIDAIEFNKKLSSIVGRLEGDEPK